MEDQGEQYKRRLVSRYTSGQATEEEVKALFTLISLGEADALKEDMDQEIDKLRNGQRKVSGSRNTVALKIVASVVLVLSLGILLIYHRNSENYVSSGTSRSKGHPDISPGANKAFLTLANGIKIDLTTAPEGKLTAENGVLINKSKGGLVVYDIQERQETPNAKENAPVLYNTVSTPRGGQWQVVLPDGSHAWLNAASSLRYPASFHDGPRIVEMTGEVYFEIAERNERNAHEGKLKKVPFIVRSGSQEVEVLGTHFNINAYADEQVIKTTLLEGSVRVKALRKSESISLKPGEQALLTEHDLKAERVSTAQAVAWKNGDFIFDDQELRTTMRQIARWYDVELVYDQAPEHIKIGGGVSRSKNLSAVLQAIELTGRVKFRIEGKRITVTQ